MGRLCDGAIAKLGLTQVEAAVALEAGARGAGYSRAGPRDAAADGRSQATAYRKSI